MQSSVLPSLPACLVLPCSVPCILVSLKNLQSTDWLVVSSLSNNSDCHCPGECRPSIIYSCSWEKGVVAFLGEKKTSLSVSRHNIEASERCNAQFCDLSKWILQVPKASMGWIWSRKLTQKIKVYLFTPSPPFTASTVAPNTRPAVIRKTASL